MIPIVEKYTEQLNAILGKDWKLKNTTHKCDWSEKLSSGSYDLRVPDQAALVARFEMIPMINCCGIVVSTRAYVAPAFEGKGLGTLLNSLRIDMARAEGYGVILCTDVTSNEKQRKILAKNGWRDIHRFVNPRTKNLIAISVVNL